MSKRLKTGRISRIAHLTKDLVKASGQYAYEVAKGQAKELASKRKDDIKDLKAQTVLALEAAKSMGELKGALMKIGQMISITDDLFLPSEISNLFKSLQKEAPPMPEEQIDKIFIKNFSKNPQELFATFDKKAIAAASIGQVHKATLKTNQIVAIKIQYPGIKKAIKNDFKNLDVLEKFFKKIFPNNPNIRNMIEELSRSIANECDYEHEMREILFFKEGLKKFEKNLHIPQVFPDFSTSEVLTMEYMTGESFERTLIFSQENKNLLGQTLYDTFIYSLFKLKRIHTDPQNGNYLFSKDSITVLDFGSTRQLSDDFLQSYSGLMKSLEEDLFDQYKEISLKLGLIQDWDTDEHVKKHMQLVAEIYLPYTKKGIYPLHKFNPVDSVRTFIKNTDLKGRSAPREEFLLLDRSLLGLFSKLKQWNAAIDWRSSLEKYRP